MRSMIEQITELARERGIMKQAIADKMGITPSYLTQKMKRGMSLDEMADIAKILRVSPFIFDRYVALLMPTLVESSTDVREMSRLIARMDKSQRAQALQRLRSVVREQ
jgi:transcriptional regulator with XRE-family HTH domain